MARGVPQDVCGVTFFSFSDGQAACGGGGVPGDEPLDGVAAERPAAAGGEQRVAGLAGALGEPGAEHR